MAITRALFKQAITPRAFDNWSWKIGFKNRAKIQGYQFSKYPCQALDLISPGHKKYAPELEKRIILLQEKAFTISDELFDKIPNALYRLRLFKPDVDTEARKTITNCIEEIKKAEPDELDAVVERLLPRLLEYIDGTIIFANEEAAEISGYPPEKAGGLNMADLIAEKHLGIALKNALKIISSGEQKNLEYELVKSNGEIIFTSINAMLISDKFPVYVQGIVDDITERKRLEEERSRAEKLAATADFAKQIADRINNPVFGVTSGIQILKSELKLKDPEQEKTFNIIENEAKRISNLIRLFRFFGIPEVAVPSLTDIHTLMGEVVSQHEKSLEKKRVKIKIRRPKDLYHLNISKDKVAKILNNLIQNAIDESDKGKVIWIVWKIDEKEQRIFIEVKDRGPGIPEDRLINIFDPLWTGKLGRIGMGLAVAKKLAFDCGGDIQYTYRKGGGSIFTVELPLKTDISQESGG